MTILICMAFLLFMGGCFLILKLTPFEFLEGASKYIKPEKITLKSKVNAIKKLKEPKELKLLFLEVEEILKLTNKSNLFSMLCVFSMLLFVIGAFVALSMNNFYLVPVMAVGFSLLPFYYIKFTFTRYKKQVNTELETALSAITTSYLRGSNTIIRAIEENTPYLNPPVQDIFASF